MFIGSLGQAALRAMLFVLGAGLVTHVMAARMRRPSFRKWSTILLRLQFLIAAVAAFCLIWLLVTENLNYAYVADYTGPGLSLIYRIAAFWGGNAGSLLFWSLILALYSLVLSFSRHEDSERMVPIVSAVMTAVSLFYVIVMNATANPFQRLPHPAVAGNGLNPLLQNPGMTVHPVNVYLGFVGFTVPFAYAIAGLLLGKTDATWLRVTRRWTLVSWLFLSIGIVYGAHWSYEELGWGGYWAWDPVENASLLPWLTATAFLHSAIVQEKKGMLKAWNVVLISLTFLLTLLGTFLTRSGVLWSIHAFANGPLGAYFLTFLITAFVVSVAIIVWRWPLLKPDRQFEAVVSKESSFMLNNVLLLGSTFAVLWGTVFPIISEALTGNKLMVSAPFYNAVNLPLAICIMVLMGIGPVVAWRKASVKSIVQVVIYPLVVSVLLGAAGAAVLWYTYHRFSSLGTAALMAAAYVMLTVFMEFWQSVRARMELTGQSWGLSLSRLMMMHRRRYGGYIVHFAIALMALGIAGSGAYHLDLQEPMKVGQTATLGDYRLTFAGMGTSEGAGTRSMYANLIVDEGGRDLGVIRPAATFYTNGQSPSTDVALYSKPLQDLYVVMLGTSQGDQAVFDFHVNPLVEFIWWGGYLFILGTLISLWPEGLKRRGAEVPEVLAWHAEVDRTYAELADLEYDYHMGKLDESVYMVQRAELTARLSEIERDDRARVRKALLAEVEAEYSHHRADENAGGQPV